MKETCTEAFQVVWSAINMILGRWERT